MFKKILLSLFFIFLYTKLFAQIKEFESKEKSACNYSQTTFSVTAENKFSIITLQERKVHVQNFKNELEFSNQQTHILSYSKCKYFLKANFDSDGLNLFYTDKKLNKIRGIHISNHSPEKHEEINAPIDFNNKEYFVEIVNYNDKNFLISVNKNSSILNFYEFKKARFSKKHQIDASNIFIESEENGTFSSAIRTAGVFDEINPDKENSVKSLFSNFKYYVIDSNLYMTIDQNDYRTYVLNVDLESFENSFKEYKKPRVNNDFSEKINSNSFIQNHVIFQAVVDKDNLTVVAYDLKTDKKISEYQIDKNFSKTSLAPNSNGTKKRVDPTRIFKKYAKGPLALQVIPFQNKYFLEFSVFNIHKTAYENPNDMDTNFNLLDCNIAPIVSDNLESNQLKSYRRLNSYSNFFIYEEGKSQKIFSMLDSNSLERLDVKKPNLALEKMGNYFKNHKLKKENVIVFEYQNKYVLGYVHDENQHIILKEFQ
ncbi:hypothetical protein [Aureivirga sp. CE67]|uniref:hypothetical protein n=1 Tax=Aureivirga sp. CE67 TaxID=1788983 RepID=UPI0018CA7D94|nr:hypothetical protein [Aureivirga sp. CE67]